MRRRTRTLSILLAVLVVGGCGLFPSAEERAAADARAKAGRVGNVMAGSRVWKANDIGHTAADLRDVEVMRVTGTSSRDHDGVRLVIRVPGHASERWLSPQAITVRRCFELVFRDGVGDGPAQKGVRCPSGAPLAYGPWPKPPEVPARVSELLNKRLPRVPAGAVVDEVKVRAVVAGLHLPSEVRTLIARDGDVVGVSLQAGSGESLDCVLARVAPSDTSVWTPSRIQRMPGEGGCDVGAAITPRPPPH